MRKRETEVVLMVARRLRAWSEKEESLADALSGEQRAIHRNQSMNYAFLADELDALCKSKEVQPRNKVGDKCLVDSMEVEQEHNHVRLVAEVDGVLFDSSECGGDTKQWLELIVERVYDCSMGKLN